jgi:hypothetical protein
VISNPTEDITKTNLVIDWPGFNIKDIPITSIYMKAGGLDVLYRIDEERQPTYPS